MNTKWIVILLLCMAIGSAVLFSGTSHYDTRQWRGSEISEVIYQLKQINKNLEKLRR